VAVVGGGAMPGRGLALGRRALLPQRRRRQLSSVRRPAPPAGGQGPSGAPEGGVCVCVCVCVCVFDAGALAGVAGCPGAAGAREKARPRHSAWLDLPLPQPPSAWAAPPPGRPAPARARAGWAGSPNQVSRSRTRSLVKQAAVPSQSTARNAPPPNKCSPTLPAHTSSARRAANNRLHRRVSPG
jgi:hypothetical protein